MKTWQSDSGKPGSKGGERLHSNGLTFATFINVIGDGQILGTLAGLLLGIAYGAREAALQGIIALVAELLLASAGIICKKSILVSKKTKNVTNPRRKICNEKLSPISIQKQSRKKVTQSVCFSFFLFLFPKIPQRLWRQIKM